MPELPSEEYRVFGIEGDETVAVLHRAHGATDSGVVVVVGGPQYRVGSHRQFVTIAREFAQAGYAVLRFDVRGMGDGCGTSRTFESIDVDIRAAVDELCTSSPHVRRVVLFGLCDGASASLMYSPSDARVRGLILLNPWVRTEPGAAKVRLRSYYLRRLLSPEFWRKLGRGGIRIQTSVREVSSSAVSAIADSPPAPFVARMQNALAVFPGRILCVLSEKDYTAKEFSEWMSSEAVRDCVTGRSGFLRIEAKGANHTFTERAHHDAVMRESLAFIEHL